MDERLNRLRIDLFTAAQSLTGADADEFWKLIDETQSLNVLFKRKAGMTPLTEKDVPGGRQESNMI